MIAKISLGAPMWSNAVVANGTLYLASQRYLWAVRDLGAKPPLSLTDDSTTPF